MISIACAVSMFVYIEFASQVKSLAVVGRVGSSRSFLRVQKNSKCRRRSRVRRVGVTDLPISQYLPRYYRL